MATVHGSEEAGDRMTAAASSEWTTSIPSRIMFQVNNQSCRVTIGVMVAQAKKEPLFGDNMDLALLVDSSSNGSQPPCCHASHNGLDFNEFESSFSME